MRPLLIGATVVATTLLAVVMLPWLQDTIASFRPALAVGTVQAAASEVPVLVFIPSDTPVPTPSATPTPTATPTITPSPSLTPTLTPSPTSTATPSPTWTPTPTVTRPRSTRRPATATATPTPRPTVRAPILVQPEDDAPFYGADTTIELTWASDHVLNDDEFHEVSLRYVQLGAEVRLPVRLQTTSWFVDGALFGKADQQTGRAYHWSVRVVQREFGADGVETYVPLSLSSEEWTFYWLP